MDDTADRENSSIVKSRQDMLAAVMRAFPAQRKPAYGRNSKRFQNYFEELPDELTEGMLSFRMNMAIGKWRTVLDRSVASHGLTLNAWHVLFAISMNGPDETMTEIAKRLATSNPAIVRILNELEASGYIRREVQPHDKRAKSLSLTEMGDRTVTALFYSINRIRKALLGGISIPEMELMIEIFDQMDANLDRLLAESVEKA